MLAFVLLAAFIWGVCIAAFMEFTDLGDFISKRLTWFITALGCGGDLLLSLLLMDSNGLVGWWHIVAVFFLSSIAVSFRGIWQLVAYYRSIMDGARNPASE